MKLEGISVIIPALNADGTIRETLKSVAAQGYGGPLEVIVIDDSSTDDTQKVASQAGDLHQLDVRVLRNQERLGEAASRNRAIKAARHDLLLTIDSDDHLVSPEIHNMSFICEAERMLRMEPHLDLVYCDILNFGALEGVHKFPEVFDVKHSLEHCDIWTPALYKKSLAEEVGGYDESLRCVVDFAFWCAAIESRDKIGDFLRVGRICKPLYAYRRWPLAGEGAKTSASFMTRDNHKLGWEMVVSRFPELYKKYFPDYDPSDLPSIFSTNEAERLRKEEI
jgi:glycosyltransferase involved in cell wall biosynthesis